MIEVVFEPNFAAWRDQARALVQQGIPPEEVHWSAGFGSQRLLAVDAPHSGTAPPQPLFKVPKAFVTLAETVAHHRDDRKWSLLYRILFRLCHEQPKLLDIAVDPDVLRLLVLEKAVRRDAHKMKAFVRFRKTPGLPGVEERYVAWYRPDHPIVRLVGPFFARRFQAMDWSILTPDESVHWDGDELLYSAGLPSQDAPQEDALDDLWRRYYVSIFNPARIKLGAMKKEMPVRFWHGLPESRVIAGLLRERESRTEAMLATQPPSAKELVPQGEWPEVKVAALSCRGCDLHQAATQTVFGEGPLTATIALVGEQPGDQEDIEGRPFVGPAGKVLDEALVAAGLRREDLYLTNAVKHFKWRPLGKRRLHSKPRAGEVAACQPWLAREMDLLKPRFLVCLGATAALSAVGRLVKINQERGEFLATPLSSKTLITFHPSAVLRAADEAGKQALFATLVKDLRKVALEAGKLTPPRPQFISESDGL